jgi:brefeldin A-resistance guanine nucleotide exchange factor 1
MKNMLLVMSNGGYLAPPDEAPERELLWVETWKRVNRFLPTFYAELFPDEAKKPKVDRREKQAKDEAKVAPPAKEDAAQEAQAEAQAQAQTQGEGVPEEEDAGARAKVAEKND